MLRRALITTLTIGLAATLAAQAPAGWKVRIDRSTSASDPDDTPDLKVTAIPKGFRVTGGPAGTFWANASASGDFVARATFRLMKPSNHVNYYGLIFGGSDLDGPNQTYLYFLVAQNGTFLIRQRMGEKVQNVQPRTPHAAIRQPDASGQSTNTLEVRVSGDTISYVVNGTVVHTTPRSGVTARTDGIVGVRINHLLDVEVEGFEVQKL